MFGNSPYDLIAPAMLAELHHEISRQGSGEKDAKSKPSEGTGLPQRIMEALAPRQASLKLAAASGDADCAEG